MVLSSSFLVSTTIFSNCFSQVSCAANFTSSKDSLPISVSKFCFAPSISTADIPIFIIIGSLFGFLNPGKPTI